MCPVRTSCTLLTQLILGEFCSILVWKSGKFKTIRVESVEDLSKLRLTVDYTEDYETVCRIFEKLKHLENDFGLEEIKDLYAKNPGLFTNQTEFERNSGWQDSLRSDQKVEQFSSKEVGC